MRILSWNIKQGGSFRRLEGIVSCIKEQDPDVVILSEFRSNVFASELKKVLLKQGFVSSLNTSVDDKTNSLLVLSKHLIQRSLSDISLNCPQRWLEFSLDGKDMLFLAVHIPGSGDKWGKEDFWKKLIIFAKQNLNTKAVIIGDFNTGLSIDTEGESFKFGDYFKSLSELGWEDCWRLLNGDTREYSWYSSKGNGFRIDHCFITSNLKGNIKRAYYSHKDRMNAHSDHSPLIVDLDI